jgi:hypothetical protein
MGVFGCGLNEDVYDASESEVRELVVTFGTTDPAVCRETVTENYAEQRSGEEGDEALESCEAVAGRPDLNVEDAEITIRTRDENSLIASAELVGGTFDGSTLIVSVVSENGEPRIDAITDADIQRDDYDRYARELLAEDGVTARETTCVLEDYEERISDEQVNEMIATGDADVPGARRVFVDCLGGDSKRKLLAQSMRSTAEDEDEDPAVVACAVDRIRALPDGVAERLFDESNQAQILRIFGRTAERCSFAADPDAEA